MSDIIRNAGKVEKLEDFNARTSLKDIEQTTNNMLDQILEYKGEPISVKSDELLPSKYLNSKDLSRFLGSGINVIGIDFGPVILLNNKCFVARIFKFTTIEGISIRIKCVVRFTYYFGRNKRFN